jgi:drug/metabolite transporter (DMT)-like permease
LSPDARRPDAPAVTALFLAQVFFAVFPVLGKIALAEMETMTIAACRVVFGSLFLPAAARLLARDEAPPTARERVTIAVLSVLGVVLNQLLYITGLSLSNAADVALLVCTIPVFTLLFGMALGREKPGLRRAAGIPVALTGALLLINVHKLDFQDRMLLGNVLVVLNCLFYSLFLIGAREILATRSPDAFTAAVFRWGTLPVLLFAAPSLRRVHPSAFSTRAWLALAGIVLFPTALSYLLNAWALTRTHASTAAVFTYVQPVLAWGLAWIVLGERPGPRFFAAAALILVGLALTSWPSRGEPEHPPETIEV